MNTVTETRIDPKNPPAVHEWTGPTGVKFRDVREPSGVYYHDTTPRAVIDALERAKATGARVRIWLGDRETGRNWLDEYDVSGMVSCSMGPIKIPLLISNSRSHGGGGIMADCIVCLFVGGREVYRHPGFKMPEIRIYQEGKHADLPWAADVATDDPGHVNPHARFKTEASARRWAAFMRGERAAK